MPSQVSFLGAEQAVDAEGRFTSPVLQKLNAVAKSQATGSFATIAYVDEQVAAGLPGPQGNTGATGPVGATGPAGPGVPVGGSSGQVLKKNSATDYDTGWLTLAAIATTGAWSSLTGTPTTLAGYGITDAQPLDGDLTSLAAASSTGALYYRSAASTWSPVTIGSGVAFGSGTLSATGTGGTVTSVGLTSTDFTVTGSPVTGTGSITANLVTQAGITAAAYGDASHSLTATVNSKGVLTGLSSQAIAIGWSAITSGKPTTLSGYGITDAQASSTGLTNFVALAWSAGTQVPALTAANTWGLKTVGSAAGNVLDKAAGDALYLAIAGTAADSSKLGGVAAASYLTTTAAVAAYQPLDGDLTSIAGNATGGFLTRSAANAYSPRTITGSTFVSVTNGDGVSGNPTISLTGMTIGTNVQAYDVDLDGLAALATTGFVKRTGSGTFTAASLVAGDVPDISATYLTVSTASATYLTTTAAAAAYQPLDGDLTSIAGNTTGGFLTRTGANTYTPRTITAGTGATVTNGDGVAGAPTIAVNYGTTSTTAAVGNDTRITGAQQMVSATVSTTDATGTNLYTVAIATGTTTIIQGRVVARRTGGAAGTAEDAAGWTIAATFKNVGGVATLVGGTQALVSTGQDQPAWTAGLLTPAGGNARLRVAGAASNNVDWKFEGFVTSVT